MLLRRVFSFLRFLTVVVFLFAILASVFRSRVSTADDFDRLFDNKDINLKTCGTCPPETTQVIYAPLFDVPEVASSELVLNCRSAHDLAMMPTFYSLDGRVIVGNPITLRAGEIRFVETKSLIPPEERNRTRWGGMSLSYHGTLLEGWAQLTLKGIRGGGSANVFFAVVNQPRPNNIESVWWMPKNAQAVIALGNSSSEVVHANLSFESGESRRVDIGPFATEIIKAKRSSATSSSAEQSHTEAVSITYSGAAGVLIPAGYISSPASKFTSTIRFYNPGRTLVILSNSMVQGIGRQNISVESPRPVAKAIEILEGRYGCPITYEDPQFAYPGDIIDITMRVRRDLDRYEPGEAPKVLAPRGGVLTFEYDDEPNASLVDRAAPIVGKMIEAQSVTNLGGRFRFEKDGQMIHVIPTRAKSEAGTFVSRPSILDAIITIPAGQRNGMEALGALCNAVTETSHMTVFLGTVPLNSFYRYQISQDGKPKKARDILVGLIRGAQTGGPVSWQLLYDPGVKMYALNIHEISALKK